MPLSEHSIAVKFLLLEEISVTHTHTHTRVYDFPFFLLSTPPSQFLFLFEVYCNFIIPILHIESHLVFQLLTLGRPYNVYTLVMALIHL